MTNYSVRPRLWDYMAWVKRQSCCLAETPEAGPCSGEKIVQAAHAGGNRGMQRKPADDTCIPLCRRHHEDMDQTRGWFLAMAPAARQRWKAQQIARTQIAYQRWRSADW